MGMIEMPAGFPIPVYTHDAKSIAVILAEELSKHLQEKLLVSQAEFVEPSSKVRNYWGVL